MRIASGSASAFQKWIKCQAGWAATYAPQNPFIKRTPDVSGSPAQMGSCLHEVIDQSTLAGEHNKTNFKELLVERLRKEWGNFLDDESRLDEAINMLEKWADRSGPDYWLAREIISQESRQSFNIPTSKGDFPIVFLFDRLDKLKFTGDRLVMEVVDYKSWMKRVLAHDLDQKIQCRIYALAVYLLYPEVDEVWVTLDQLRYDQASRVFTKEECQETFQELIAIAEDILATEIPAETINDECRYCARLNQCATFKASLDVEGGHTITDLDEAGRRYLELTSLQNGLYRMREDLESFFWAEAQQRDLVEMATEEVDVTFDIETKRKLDKDAFSNVLTVDEIVRFTSIYGNPGVTSITKACKDKNSYLTLEQQNAIFECITEEYGKQKVKVAPR